MGDQVDGQRGGDWRRKSLNRKSEEEKEKDRDARKLRDTKRKNWRGEQRRERKI